MHPPLSKKTAIRFIILLGFVSLFADMTYEGARSITGQYLAILGASGTVVGIVSGLGEFIGYAFRLVSGYASDRTGRYWTAVFVGYACNLLAVPLLALAGNWPLAVTLILLERLGKAIRSPAKDAMVSYATSEIGRGWGFGLHEMMDQIGAILGPLIVSVVLYTRGSYEASFALLLIPGLCALSVLACARFLYPRPQDLEVTTPVLHGTKFTKKYWLYIAAVCCIAVGYVDFPLIAYHFKQVALMPDDWMPVLFALAMAADGIAALIFGHLYDKKGISILIIVILVAAPFVLLVFLNNLYAAIVGMVLWGIGLGAQESIMRAVVANLIHKANRGTAYGIMNIWFGVFWFLGSAAMGFLYDTSLVGLVIFSFGFQLLSIPFLLAVNSANHK